MTLVWASILLLILVTGLNAQATDLAQGVGPAQTYTLSGRVYEGNVGLEPPNSTPLQGVTVSLYCSNNHGVQGTFQYSTTTDSYGWYGLNISDTVACEYYNIVETDPVGYFSNGATTVGGNVINENWIEYTYPLDGQTLTGNKFWDETNHVYLPITLRNYQ